ncbi:hypothetical protein PVK06_032313 [Gossypium arboreum]|uniref:F-box domain-containing protein n=1 Tax=Gossypium arboreum TaxID=29729 RepID=A0ABR0NTF3_GOSAR|nr:hypothetical protein PVK06_032313 [Gossypium arboreum]
MGAYFSALFINQGGLSSVSSSSPSLGDLPESCVASIIGYLDPPEICKLGKLNRAFRGASWADFVWESKLPSNYQVLVDKILTFVPENLGKREIYSLLCTTNTLDGGTKVWSFTSLSFIVFVWIPRKLGLKSWVFQLHFCVFILVKTRNFTVIFPYESFWLSLLDNPGSS